MPLQLLTTHGKYKKSTFAGEEKNAPDTLKRIWTTKGFSGAERKMLVLSEKVSLGALQPNSK